MYVDFDFDRFPQYRLCFARRLNLCTMVPAHITSLRRAPASGPVLAACSFVASVAMLMLMLLMFPALPGFRPQIEIWNNGSASQSFSVALTVADATGKTVGSAAGKGTLDAGRAVNWSPASPIVLAGATLWHVVQPPNKPALYTATVVLTVGGKPVDSVTETFGVRKTNWTGAEGFFLNDKPFKILGNANHQDFAAVGVAVPDHLQWYRVQGQKNWVCLAGDLISPVFLSSSFVFLGGFTTFPRQFFPSFLPSSFLPSVLLPSFLLRAVGCYAT